MKHFRLSKPEANTMERNDEWQQMMEEREQMTEEVFIRAKLGMATENDWKWLANELGLDLYKRKANVDL